jgi:HSP20 family molecular chaperone IbpA
VNREDVEITFSDSVLSVSGEHRSELDEEEVSFYVRNATTELSEGA